MGRRSTHTPEQLRQLILDAAQAIIETNGLAGLSAREIARRIGYSPGTIYNMFQNLDDVVLHVEARVLDALDQRLSAAARRRRRPRRRSSRLAQAYLAFTQREAAAVEPAVRAPHAGRHRLPAWYQQKLEVLMRRVEEALAPLFAPGDEAALQRAARVLWAGVHGITSLSTADKLSMVTTEAAGRLVRGPHLQLPRRPQGECRQGEEERVSARTTAGTRPRQRQRTALPRHRCSFCISCPIEFASSAINSATLGLAWRRRHQLAHGHPRQLHPIQAYQAAARALTQWIDRNLRAATPRGPRPRVEWGPTEWRAGAAACPSPPVRLAGRMSRLGQRPVTRLRA